MLAYDTSHAPGRNEAGRQQIRDGRPVFGAPIVKLGAISLDGTASTHAVANQLLGLAFGPQRNRGTTTASPTTAPEAMHASVRECEPVGSQLRGLGKHAVTVISIIKSGWLSDATVTVVRAGFSVGK